MKTFPLLKSCRVLPAGTPLLGAELPVECHFGTSKGYVAFTFKHREFVLGFSKEGWMCGFLTSRKLHGDLPADIIVIKHSGRFRFYEARFISPADFERELERLADKPEPPAPKFERPSFLISNYNRSGDQQTVPYLSIPFSPPERTLDSGRKVRV